MLQSFEGIIDASGLRSLRQDDGFLHQHATDDGSNSKVPFWAVLDTQDATVILRELLSGNRLQALKLLEECAITLGSKNA